MPSKSSIFKPLSILFRPHQKPVRKVFHATDRFLVEAPGTETIGEHKQVSSQNGASEISRLVAAYVDALS